METTCFLQLLEASDETLLLRLRNPWGFGQYLGPWSEGLS